MAMRSQQKTRPEKKRPSKKINRRAGTLEPRPRTSRERIPVLKLRLPQTTFAKRTLTNRKRLSALLQELWRTRDPHCADVEVNFVSEATIRDLHQRFLRDSTPTDIITFDLGMTPHQHRLAAIYICPEVAQRHAERFKTSITEELQRLVIHGVLHLLGYDDKSPSQRQRMRTRENQILRSLIL